MLAAALRRCSLPAMRRGTLNNSTSSSTRISPQVRDGYFRGLVEAGTISEASLEQHIFASKPAAGGAVLTLKL